ncbi:MAG: hypothetical protein OEZ27_06465, partial [Nitrospinota bacterium]|nr:hypothetical protein [Nitrospinota bacterium]
MTDTLPSKNDEQRILDALQEKLGWQSPDLDLSYDRLGDVGVTFLARKFNLSHVRMLNLSWNEISDVGLKALAACTTLSNLTHLHLDSNRIGDAGAQTLA